jgi:hypothetical protein
VIGMVDLGEFVVGLLDIRFAGLLGHTQDLVVIFLGVEVGLVEHSGPGTAGQLMQTGYRR